MSNNFEITVYVTTRQDGSLGHYSARSREFETAEERDEALSAYAKGLKLRPVTIHSLDEKTRYGFTGHGDLAANGANGGVNETGLKRLGKLLKVAAYDSEVNIANVATLADVEKAIAEAAADTVEKAIAEAAADTDDTDEIDFDTIGDTPAPGTVDAARAELERRKANRAAKRNAEPGTKPVRIEPASSWAFAASKSELDAIIAEAG